MTFLFCSRHLNPPQKKSFCLEKVNYCQHKPKDSPDTQKKTACCWDIQGWCYFNIWKAQFPLCILYILIYLTSHASSSLPVLILTTSFTWNNTTLLACLSSPKSHHLVPDIRHLFELAYPHLHLIIYLTSHTSSQLPVLTWTSSSTWYRHHTPLLAGLFSLVSTHLPDITHLACPHLYLIIYLTSHTSLSLSILTYASHTWHDTLLLGCLPHFNLII